MRTTIQAKLCSAMTAKREVQSILYSVYIDYILNIHFKHYKPNDVLTFHEFYLFYLQKILTVQD